MKNGIIINYNGKQYRPYAPKHPCRDRRACALFERGICDCDGYVDRFPCDWIVSAINACDLVVGCGTNYKEVKK